MTHTPTSNLVNFQSYLNHETKSNRDNKYSHELISNSKEDTNTKTEMLRKSLLINDLYIAIINEQLEVYYQPQIDINTKNIIGVEALVRWNHPQLGFISPEEFIPLLEEMDLINLATEFILYTACDDLKQCSMLSPQPLKLSINLLPQQLIDGTSLPNIDRILAETDFPPELLTLEIIESSSINDFEKTKETITELKKLGISIAIDDFGTGFSSFVYLQQLPVDIVKIDKSFVMDCDKSHKQQVLVKGLINIAQSLNLEVVAEGIETEIELGLMEDFNCDYGQGYLISKPLSLHQLLNFMLKYDLLNQQKIA